MQALLSNAFTNKYAPMETTGVQHWTIFYVVRAGML
jgi:hypothetical protein